MRDEERTQALCAQTDPDLFNPVAGSPTNAARKVCMQCPVRRSCLREVLSIEGGESGIWAALDSKQRVPLLAALRDADGDPVLISEIIDEGMRIADVRLYLSRAERQARTRAKARAAVAAKARGALAATDREAA